jgi:hypothetical protein
MPDTSPTIDDALASVFGPETECVPVFARARADLAETAEILGRVRARHARRHLIAMRAELDRQIREDDERRTA